MKTIQVQIPFKLNSVLVRSDSWKKKLKLNLGEVRELELKKVHEDFYALLVEDSPTIFEDTMKSLDSPFWKEIVDNKIQFIVQNHTWELTSLPPGCKIIGCQWVFKKKLRPDGVVDKYKAILIAKGFNQKSGINYFDIYSPVARITTNRVLLSFNLYNKWMLKCIS